MKARLEAITVAQRRILDKATSEKRELSRAEQKEYDALEKEYHQIKAGETPKTVIISHEDQEWQTRKYGHILKPEDERYWQKRYNRDDDEVRILAPNESFRSALGLENEDRLSLGKMVKGAVTGELG